MIERFYEFAIIDYHYYWALLGYVPIRRFPKILVPPKPYWHSQTIGFPIDNDQLFLGNPYFRKPPLTVGSIIFLWATPCSHFRAERRKSASADSPEVRGFFGRAEV